jgi:N-acetylglucosaminyldiphosphoundecaprenol N-acetyl-beta-D-mannosaminyltransferase
MKILFVANVSDLYGASRSLLRLAGQLVKDGHRVEVILPSGGPLRERLEEAGAATEVHKDLAVLTRRELRTVRGCARLGWKLLKSTADLILCLRRVRPDIVHTNSAVVLSSGLAARICGRPHVWHMREFFADISPLWRAYQWLMYLLASVIVCNSGAVAGQFHPAIRRRKIAVVYNGIPAGEVAPATAERAENFRRRHALAGGPLVGVVGRVNLEQKGQDVFVTAAAALAEKFPEAGFVVAGSPYPGNEEHGRRLGRMIEALNLHNRIVCTGDVDDLAALYSVLDVCVLPAKKPEGLGNVLLEAMALGKPVVGTRTGGIPEVIEDGENGYLVEPGDGRSLATTLERLLADPELRRRMGEMGRRRFEDRFSFTGCYARMLSLYGWLLEKRILGMRVDPTSYPDAVGRILGWARDGESRYVCAASVNNVMEGYDSAEFRRIMNGADLVTPDGMPLVWGLRMLGMAGATRVYGPDLMRATLAAAERAGVPVGFYGATDGVLARLLAAVRRRYPRLDVRYAFAPPFRPLSEAEDAKVVRELRESGARILFVGLSTPKQERWMAAHRGRIPAVMLGIGAAFDFLAGVKPQAPRWMQGCGLEWLFRLATEPRRLWRRYLKHNPRFATLFALQWLEHRFTA